MAHNINHPRIVIGDCNVILHQEEKRGRFPFNEREARKFNKIIWDCGLVELGFIGYTYTWRTDADFIEQRLYRAIVISRWNATFPNSNLRHLSQINSDHIPICLNTRNTWNIDGADPI